MDSVVQHLSIISPPGAAVLFRSIKGPAAQAKPPCAEASCPGHLNLICSARSKHRPGVAPWLDGITRTCPGSEALLERAENDGEGGARPPTAGPLPRSPALAPFRVRSYRFQWPADLFTSCAFEMETLILGWYVLVETESVLMLTVFGALLFGGTLVSPLFGVLGDRIGQRSVLCAMRAVYVVLAATLLTIALSGHLSPLLVLVVTGLMGLVRPSDLGVRIALIADTMPAERLTAAMGISRTTSDSARIAGALTGAGVFALLGIGPAYVAVVSLYALGLMLTLGVTNLRRSAHPETAHVILPRPSAWGDLREGLAHVWASPQLLAAMLLVLLVNLTAFPLSNGLLPYVVREVYRLDQTALGYMVAAFSSGALVGSLVVSLREIARPARTMLVAAVIWHGFLLVFAQMQGLFGGVITLMLAGFAQSICIVSLTVLLLRTCDERFRGRVISVRMLSIYSLPLGLLASGTLIDACGFSATATLYAGLGMACTLAIALRWRTELWHAPLPMHPSSRTAA